MSVSKSKFSQRHDELELIVQKILVENGVSGLSIERIATESGYSRPTIYQHFSGKIEAIEAVARRCLERIADLVGRAGTVEGAPRERALALVIAYEQMARFHPNNFHINEILSFPWVRNQLPPDLAADHAATTKGYFEQFISLLGEAQKAGALDLPPGVSLEQATFQSIATAFGIYNAIVKKRYAFALSESADPWKDARSAINALWDGLGWDPRGRPPSDYEAVYERILKSAFPEYWIKAKTEDLTKEAGLV
ncbi:TetR/AcrR family transcriptional regulator [soil metagenome]